MRPAIHIEVQATLGAAIEDVCIEVQHLASTMRIEVRCRANDVHLYARPRGDWHTLLEAFHRASTNPGAKFRAAHSWKE